MIIPNITPLPPSPQRTDPSTFAARADASLTAQETVFTPELNAFASAVNVTQAEMTVLSATATEQAQIATTQAAAAASSALSAGATVWVSGTTYTAGVSKYSPLNGQVYRRMIAGAGTTDPSLDPVNWRVVNGLTSELIVLPFNNLPSMRPSLNLDFANNQSVDPRITFTRASTATRINAKGLIEVVASGVPRIDFDAVTGACKGLLLEEQRTNLFTYSEAFDNAAWSKNVSTVNPNATTAPDGLVTADYLVESAASSDHSVFVAQTLSTATAYTLSVFCKAGTRTKIGLSFGSTAFGGSAIRVHFDLSNGAFILSSGAPDAYSITPVPGGWYRVSVTKTTSASATGSAAIYTMDTSGAIVYTGDGTSGLFIWGAQLEAGAFPTSYIPTVASQVTRAADVASMTGANFSSWYRSDEGSFVAEFSRLSNAVGGRVFVAHDGTPNEQLRVSSSVSVNIRPDFQIIDGGVVQANVTGAAEVATGAFAKCAAAYAINSISSAVNGALGTADTAATLPTLTTLGIGTSEVATTQLNGHIRSLSYYPKRLTNAELVALSTQ